MDCVSPHMHNSHTVNIPQQSSTSARKLMHLHWHMIIIQSPAFTWGFTLATGHIMDLGKLWHIPILGSLVNTTVSKATPYYESKTSHCSLPTHSSSPVPWASGSQLRLPFSRITDTHLQPRPPCHKVEATLWIHLPWLKGGRVPCPWVQTLGYDVDLDRSYWKVLNKFSIGRALISGY